MFLRGRSDVAVPLSSFYPRRLEDCAAVAPAITKLLKLDVVKSFEGKAQESPLELIG